MSESDGRIAKQKPEAGEQGLISQRGTWGGGKRRSRDLNADKRAECKIWDLLKLGPLAFQGGPNKQKPASIFVLVN
jgi:hypothetical protein